MTRRLRQGEVIRLRLLGSDDEWTVATVWVASTNGKAVGVVTDSPIRVPNGGMILGGVALVIDFEAETVKGLLFDEEYEIEVQEDGDGDADTNIRRD